MIVMYVGNLQEYQGIDLLLESFSLLHTKLDGVSLLIVGGQLSNIEKYRKKTDNLGLHDQVKFLGNRPTNQLKLFLSQADILVSPRIKGKNTPMKIYSYLDSGKAVLATDLPTHTQVLNERIALLAKPEPKEFSQALLKLIKDEKLRRELGREAKSFVQENHSYQAFCQKLNGLYDWLTNEQFLSNGIRAGGRLAP